MQAMFLMMMLAVGADQNLGAQPTGIPVPPTPVLVGGDSGAFPGLPGPYRYDPPRDPQEADGLVRGFLNYCVAWWKPMPQTCYSPHYGCYPGNGRDIYRYPAFHGYYYRAAYNYRPLFEYPWQADMHEPLPLEVSSGCPVVGGPPASQPQRVEVITTPPANLPHWQP